MHRHVTSRDLNAIALDGHANNARSDHLHERYDGRHMLRLPRRDPTDRLLQLDLRILQYRLLRRRRHW